MSDWNLYVIESLADDFCEETKEELIIEPPDNEVGLLIVRLFDEVVIARRNLLRRKGYAKDILTFLKFLATLEAFPFKYTKSDLVASAYTWLGCICLGKTLRPTYNSGKWGETTKYDNRYRWSQYREIKKILEQNGVKRYWMNYGMSLTHALEMSRNNKVYTDWLPLESPYWDYLDNFKFVFQTQQ